MASLTGKKKKMSTMAKSQIDWDKFKETEGKEFEHEMEQNKKSGYVCPRNIDWGNLAIHTLYHTKGTWTRWPSFNGQTCDSSRTKKIFGRNGGSWTAQVAAWTSPVKTSQWPTHFGTRGLSTRCKLQKSYVIFICQMVDDA